MLRKLTLGLLPVVVMLVVSCAADSESAGTEPKLSTDIINNPKTLEEGEVVTTSTRALPVMSFERDKFDFGDIIQGEGREFSFKFSNTGEAPLVISNAKGSCGCTVPDWPQRTNCSRSKFLYSGYLRFQGTQEQIQQDRYDRSQYGTQRNQALHFRKCSSSRELIPIIHNHKLQWTFSNFYYLQTLQKAVEV